MVPTELHTSIFLFCASHNSWWNLLNTSPSLFYMCRNWDPWKFCTGPVPCSLELGYNVWHLLLLCSVLPAFAARTGSAVHSKAPAMKLVISHHLTAVSSWHWIVTQVFLGLAGSRLQGLFLCFSCSCCLFVIFIEIYLQKNVQLSEFPQSENKYTLEHSDQETEYW